MKNEDWRLKCEGREGWLSRGLVSEKVSRVVLGFGTELYVPTYDNNMYFRCGIKKV